MSIINKELIKNISFFSDLHESEIARLDFLFRKKTFKKGTTLFHEGDYGEELYIIEKGAVKIYKEDCNKEIILTVLKAGDYFGEMGLLQYTEHRSANAETLEPCVLYTLRRSEFVSMLEETPGMLLNLLFHNMTRLRKANELIKNLTTLDARTRIIKTLIDLSEEHGTDTGESLIINLKFTHQQLADMSGVVRETVSKVLSELQNDQIISIDQKKIIIKKAADLEKKLNV